MEALKITLLRIKTNLKPAQILALGFAGLILIGTILLMMPMASKSGRGLDFVNALFTATSAVCITGLVVVDTANNFTLFGQLVILILVQIGGLGIMTTATLVFLILGKKITLKERLIMQESLNQFNLSGLVRLTKHIILFTIIIETIGAILLSFRFSLDYGIKKGIYYGIFHSISAFNNAGFDLIGNYKSLTQYVEDPIVNLVIMGLVVIGGLGFSVIDDVITTRNFHRLSLHSKVVLTTTGILLCVGFVLFYILEFTNPKTLGALTPSAKVLAAAFQSVTSRSSGFVTLNIKNMTTASIYLTLLFMFIGASPGSTGGGIKTTTFTVIIMIIHTIFTGKEDVEIYERRISTDTVFKAVAIAVMSMILLITSLFVLTMTESLSFLEILFEAVSAVATCGLSLGATVKLTKIGKILIMITMFTGRFGPLSLMLVLAGRKKKVSLKYPEERILLG